MRGYICAFTMFVGHAVNHSCSKGTIDFGGNSQSSTCFWWQSKGSIVAHTRDSQCINRANWSLQVGNFIPFEVLNTLKQWPMKEHLDNYFAYMPLPSHRPSSFALCFSSILFYVGKSNLLKTFRGQGRICIWLKQLCSTIVAKFSAFCKRIC